MLSNIFGTKNKFFSVKVAVKVNKITTIARFMVEAENVETAINNLKTSVLPKWNNRFCTKVQGNTYYYQKENMKVELCKVEEISSSFAKKCHDLNILNLLVVD